MYKVMADLNSMVFLVTEIINLMHGTKRIFGPILLFLTTKKSYSVRSIVTQHSYQLPIAYEQRRFR